MFGKKYFQHFKNSQRNRINSYYNIPTGTERLKNTERSGRLSIRGGVTMAAVYKGVTFAAHLRSGTRYRMPDVRVRGKRDLENLQFSLALRHKYSKNSGLCGAPVFVPTLSKIECGLRNVRASNVGRPNG